MEESSRKAKEFRKRKKSANRDFKSGRISREAYDSILKQIRDEAQDAWGQGESADRIQGEEV